MGRGQELMEFVEGKNWGYEWWVDLHVEYEYSTKVGVVITASLYSFASCKGTEFGNVVVTVAVAMRLCEYALIYVCGRMEWIDDLREASEHCVGARFGRVYK